MKFSIYLSWFLRLLVALIFIQTLYYKFTGHPESVRIFSTLGVEPYGRVSLGVAELIASVLILVNRTKILGLIFSFVMISGALISHFFVLGVAIDNDNGKLFALAVVVFLSCIGLFMLHKKEIQGLFPQLK